MVLVRIIVLLLVHLEDVPIVLTHDLRDLLIYLFIVSLRVFMHSSYC